MTNKKHNDYTDIIRPDQMTDIQVLGYATMKDDGSIKTDEELLKEFQEEEENLCEIINGYVDKNKQNEGICRDLTNRFKSIIKKYKSYIEIHKK